MKPDWSEKSSEVLEQLSQYFIVNLFTELILLIVSSNFVIIYEYRTQKIERSPQINKTTGVD